MESKYDGMTYSELLRKLSSVDSLPSKEARQMHRALKRFGDGLSLWDRYPLLPMWLSVLAFAVSAAVLLLLLM